MDAGSRPDIDQIIRCANSVFVMFNDDDGIAKVAQIVKRLDKFCVVALMKADRRFVENIERADQPRTDLRRKPDALGFAAGKRSRFAVERRYSRPTSIMNFNLL